LNSNQVYQPILNQEQLDTLEVSSDKDPFDGDPKKFRLGVEALRLGLAYEYDPYFSLSIARVAHFLTSLRQFTITSWPSLLSHVPYYAARSSL